MKLISCHIENFGKLHDCTLHFEDGLNTLCEENGWGKSTFAAFVRAMFYGLEGDRKRSLEENERKRYIPWQGGVFGGQLTFEANGKEYRISRVFRDKDVNDEFELREVKTNLISTDYSKKIGEELFQINRESFMRTIFMGQNDCETLATDDINAKIGKLTDNSNDLSSFDAAHTRLSELINGMNPSRATGSITKRRDEIARLERLAADGAQLSASMDFCQEQLEAEEKLYDSLREDMDATTKLQQEVAGLQTILAKKSEWERLCGITAAKEERVKEVAAQFPGVVPTSADVKAKIADGTNMERYYERMDTYRMTEEEGRDYDRLRIVFGGGVPREEELDEQLQKVAELQRLNQQHNEEKMTSAQRARLEELEPYFAREQGNVNSLISKWNARMAKKVALPSGQVALKTLKATEEKEQASRKRPAYICLIIGLILAVVAILLANLWLWWAGGVLGAVSIVLLCITFVLHRKIQKTSTQEVSPQVAELTKSIEEEEAFIASVEEEVTEFLSLHNKPFDEYSVSGYLQEIASDALEYNSLQKRARLEAESNVAEEIRRISDKLSIYLRKFGIVANPANFTEELYSLKNQAGRYLYLQDKREKFREAEDVYIPLKVGIKTFLKDHGYTPEDNLLEQLNHICEKADEYGELFRGYREAKEGLERFRAEIDMDKLEELPQMDNLPSLEDLNQRIRLITDDMEKVHSAVLSYNKNLEAMQEQYDEWEESCLKLEELRLVQEKELKKYNYVLKARVKLALAKETLTARYAEPIMERFCRYFALITGDVKKSFHMDANTNVTVDELGKQREVNTLSTGYRDLVGICLRVALVDVMYEKEVPILIMDDPFINLDDEKLRAGSAFLKEVAEKYQVIYFTCSNTRNYQK